MSDNLIDEVKDALEEQHVPVPVPLDELPKAEMTVDADGYIKGFTIKDFKSVDEFVMHPAGFNILPEGEPGVTNVVAAENIQLDLGLPKASEFKYKSLEGVFDYLFPETNPDPRVKLEELLDARTKLMNGGNVDDVFRLIGSVNNDVTPFVMNDTGNPKDAIGNTKPDLSLVPQAFNLMVSQAMMDGAKKYGPYNWRDNPVRARVYIAAAMRHLAQFLDGEDVDPTSGVYHIGHAGACLAILSDALTVGNLIDDRPKPGQSGELIRRFGETKSFKPE